jgi:RNA polymerase primary sigma factor
MITVDRLNTSEEASLARLVKQGHVRAKKDLVSSNLPLVLHIAKHYRGSLPLEDKIQEGVTGLIRAAELFEPERGVPFGSYAAFWIRQAISRAIANQSRDIRIPVQVHVRLRRAEKEAEVLERKLGRAPTMDELGREMNMPPKKLSYYARMAESPLSLSFVTGEAEGSLRPLGGDVTPMRPKTPEAAVLHDVLHKGLMASLGTLTDRERYVLGRRFGLCGTPATTLRGIAKDLGLSRERIRQIVNQSLRKIRESEFGPSLEAFCA